MTNPISSSACQAEDGAFPARHEGSLFQQRALALLKQTDVTIQRLDKLLSTSSGQETALGTIEYLSHALHHFLLSTPWIALQTRLTLLSRLRAKRRATQLASPAPASSSPLLSLSSLISEARYTLRLFGLIPLWMWGSATVRSPPEDPVIRRVTLMQVFVNILYQLLENVAYLASKDIISKKFIDRFGGIEKWYLWSTRAWFGHILLQFISLWRQRQLLRRKDQEQATMCEKITESKGSESVNNAQNDVPSAAEARRLEIRQWSKSLFSNLIWAPLCVHWSLEKGIGIPSSVTGLCSFLAGVWELHDSWAATTS